MTYYHILDSSEQLYARRQLIWPRVQYVPFGTAVTIQCKSFYYPSWTLNDYPLPANIAVLNNHIFIATVSVFSFGIYTCKGISKNGTAFSASARVRRLKSKYFYKIYYSCTCVTSLLSVNNF